MTQLPLFGPGSRGGTDTLAPSAPRRKPQTPVWTRPVVKVPPPCSRCLQETHEKWGRGDPFTGIPRAKYRRQTGPGEYEDYCNDHAEPRKAADEAAKKPAGNYTGWAKRKSTR